jgi:hypothetical protein
MKRLFLLGIPLLAISACVPQSAPPPPAVAAAPYAVGSAANTTTAFDGNYGTVIVRQVSPGCADPRFANVGLTITNGLAQAQGLNLTFRAMSLRKAHWRCRVSSAKRSRGKSAPVSS